MRRPHAHHQDVYLSAEALTDQEHAVLQLADSGLEGGRFLNAVRDLGFSGQTAYWRLLNELIETEKALAAYPGLVNRLRRLRAARTARRGYGGGQQ